MCTILLTLVGVSRSDLGAQTPDRPADAPVTISIPGTSAADSTLVEARQVSPATESAFDSATVEASGRDRPLLWLVSTDAIDRARLAELAGGKSGIPFLLRSTSTLFASTDRTPMTVRALLPEVQVTHNSSLPFSVNDGGLWAGRGMNTRIVGGFSFRRGRLSVLFAPEIVLSQNQEFQLRVPGVERPPIAPDRSEWQFEWYAWGPYSIDMPTRFGDAAIRRIYPGQSSIALRVGRFEFGPAWENHWWGPGISNALILSNNAPGFGHLFVRPSSPLKTRLGAFDFRWIVGGLGESRYFDTVSTNDVRSLSAAAATLSLRRPAGLTIGAARSVWGTADNFGQSALRWLDVFRDTGRPGNRALNDSTLYPGGYDQVFSLFARWVFPGAGLETYGEWGRTEFPASLRDLFVAPNHTQAYTLGLQWRRLGFRDDDFWRLHVENTSVEQSATFRDRPLGVWYTSRRVIQGYTHHGQVLGAAVGPGSSGQNVIVDYFAPHASFGLKAGRMRLNEDVRGISDFPLFKSWCVHDIYLYWGARGGVETPVGLVSLDLTLANRMNVWFQTQSGCPRGDGMVDIRNRTVSLTLSPSRRPR